jgi:structural maintenance of chromosome 4
VDLEREIATAETALEDLQRRAGVIEQSIKALNKKVEEAGGSRLLLQRSKVDGLRNYITIANDEVTKAEVAKAKAEKDVKRLMSAIEAHGENIGQAEREVADWGAQLTEIKDKVAEYNNVVAHATGAVEEAKDYLDELKQELDAKMELTRAFRKQEVCMLGAANSVRVADGVGSSSIFSSS